MEWSKEKQFIKHWKMCFYMSLIKHKNGHDIVIVLEDVLGMYEFQKYNINEKCVYWIIAEDMRVIQLF